MRIYQFYSKTLFIMVMFHLRLVEKSKLQQQRAAVAMLQNYIRIVQHSTWLVCLQSALQQPIIETIVTDFALQQKMKRNSERKRFPLCSLNTRNDSESFLFDFFCLQFFHCCCCCAFFESCILFLIFLGSLCVYCEVFAFAFKRESDTVPIGFDTQ